MAAVIAQMENTDYAQMFAQMAHNTHDNAKVFNGNIHADRIQVIIRCIKYSKYTHLSFNDPKSQTSLTGDVDDWVAIVLLMQYLRTNPGILGIIVIPETHMTPFLIKFFNKIHRNVCTNFIVMTQTNILPLLAGLFESDVFIHKCDIMSPLLTEGLIDIINTLITTKQIICTNQQGGLTGYNSRSSLHGKLEFININTFSSEDTNIRLLISDTGEQPQLFTILELVKNFILMSPNLIYASQVLLTKADDDIFGNTGSTLKAIMAYNPDRIELQPEVHDVYMAYIDELLLNIKAKNQQITDERLAIVNSLLDNAIFGNNGDKPCVVNMLSMLEDQRDIILDIEPGKMRIKTASEFFATPIRLATTFKQPIHTPALFDTVLMSNSIAGTVIPQSEAEKATFMAAFMPIFTGQIQSAYYEIKTFGLLEI